MPRKIPERELKKHGQERHKRSSELYKYVAENMVGLRAQGYGTRNGPPWSKLVAQATKDGLTRANGEALSVDVVRKVFARADRTLAAEERQRRTGGGPKRQDAPRAPAGWQPPVARPGPVKAAPPQAAQRTATATENEQAPFAPRASSTGSTDHSRMTPQERLADLRRVIDGRSGR